MEDVRVLLLLGKDITRGVDWAKQVLQALQAMSTLPKAVMLIT